MYWGQVAVALLAATATVTVLLLRGWSWLGVVLAGVLVYIGIRWLIAWVYRIRYWYRRGSQGHYSRSCPNCGQYIYRLSHDWILTCGRCGWTAGWPGVRWLTHSVPSRQLRRTVVGPRLIVAIVALSILTIGGVADAGPMSDQDDIDTEVPNASVLAEPATVTPAPESDGSEQESASTSTASITGGDIDPEQAEQLIFERMNALRSERGLRTLSEGDVPSQFAEEHSEDMGVHDFYGHEGPNGESSTERMAEIGRECDGAASENIHRAPLDTRVRIYGSDELVNVYNESALAKYAVQGWMNSPGHRENLLDDRWSEAGVGVHVDEQTVFMTIVFC